MSERDEHPAPVSVNVLSDLFGTTGMAAGWLLLGLGAVIVAGPALFALYQIGVLHLVGWG